MTDQISEAQKKLDAELLRATRRCFWEATYIEHLRQTDVLDAAGAADSALAEWDNRWGAK